MLSIEPDNLDKALMNSLQDLPSVSLAVSMKGRRDGRQRLRMSRKYASAISNHLIVRQVLLALPGSQRMRFRLVNMEWKRQLLTILSLEGLILRNAMST